MPISFNFSGHKESTKEIDYEVREDFILKKKNAFLQTINDENIGFFRLPENESLLEQSKKVHDSFKHKKVFVHIGIGGSSLGPQMLIKALKKITNDCRFIFINNIDPDEISDQLSNLNFSDCLFYFVSKSGGTVETMANLAIISELLSNKGINKNKLSEYFVFATDPKTGHLKKLGEELGITMLPIPSNVGGRFSVLTPVGLLPALFAGINCDDLLTGAAASCSIITGKNLKENSLFKTCFFLYDLYKLDHNQTVLLPYSSKLKDLSFWFTQLWAESLGKKYDLDGNIIHSGLTPIPAYGATDQHSQMQLFMEGPNDKCIIFIEVEKFNNQLALSNKIDSPVLSKLDSYTLAELMSAELNGTLKACESQSRPFIHIKIPAVNASSLGALIIFFESLTVLMGKVLNIDPFNQPGVEAGKEYALEFLDAKQI